MARINLQPSEIGRSSPSSEGGARSAWGMALGALCVGATVSLVLSAEFEPRYRSVAVIELTATTPPKIGAGDEERESPSWLDGIGRASQIERWIKRRAVISPILARNVSLLETERRSLDQVADEVARQLVVEWAGGDDFELRARAKSPELAKRLALGLARAAMAEHRAQLLRHGAALEAQTRRAMRRDEHRLAALSKRATSADTQTIAPAAIIRVAPRPARRRQNYAGLDGRLLREGMTLFNARLEQRYYHFAGRNLADMVDAPRTPRRPIGLTKSLIFTSGAISSLVLCALIIWLKHPRSAPLSKQTVT